MSNQNDKDITKKMIDELHEGGPDLMGEFGPLWWVVIYFIFIAGLCIMLALLEILSYIE